MTVVAGDGSNIGTVGGPGVADPFAGFFGACGGGGDFFVRGDGGRDGDDNAGGDIKFLNVAKELEREILPLKMGQRIYKIQGLKESAWYEVKISYPASIPASFSLELKKNLTEHKVPIGRRLLNTEKIIFKFDRNNWNSAKDEAFVLVIVEPAGVVAKPNVQNEEFVMFNIICEELAVGIPHRAWWVGIAALLCLLLAAVIPYYLPPQLLLRIQDMGNDSVVKNS